MNYGRSPIGAKRFKFQGTTFATIEGIAIIGAQFFHIKFFYTTPNFFVGGKQDAYFSVFYFRMLHHIRGKIHNDGHPRFIVGPQQGIA